MVSSAVVANASMVRRTMAYQPLRSKRRRGSLATSRELLTIK
jgi:hypothetical protein